MLKLLIGKKGSGKTKKLIDAAELALKNSKGNVIVIEKGAKLTYEISHKARLIDVESYGISGKEAMYGFISGICAGNYDVTDILIDATLKIIGQDMKDLEVYINNLKSLSESINITLLVSAAEEDLPESIKDLV